MGSSPEGLTTHAQEPVDPHFPSVKLPKATPRSKAPASWRDILHPTPDHVGPWAITTCPGAGCATSDVMITVGTDIGWLVRNTWLVGKSFELRGQKQPTDSVTRLQLCPFPLHPKQTNPFAQPNFKAITPCDDSPSTQG